MLTVKVSVVQNNPIDFYGIQKNGIQNTVVSHTDMEGHK